MRDSTHDILGPTHLLFSLTNAYASCIVLKVQISGGTDWEHCAAARITSAITSVAERETPHWQLRQSTIQMAKRSESPDGLTGSICHPPVQGPGQRMSYRRGIRPTQDRPVRETTATVGSACQVFRWGHGVGDRWGRGAKRASGRSGM